MPFVSPRLLCVSRTASLRCLIFLKPKSFLNYFLRLPNKHRGKGMMHTDTPTFYPSVIAPVTHTLLLSVQQQSRTGYGCFSSAPTFPLPRRQATCSIGNPGKRCEGSLKSILDLSCSSDFEPIFRFRLVVRAGFAAVPDPRSLITAVDCD